MGQNEHRFALLKTLADHYNGAKGELTLVDLESVLRSHELMERWPRRSGRRLIGAYTEHRGAAGRVGWALGLSPSELQRLIAALGLQHGGGGSPRALPPRGAGARHLTQRLDLLGRDKYLADLGIKKRFTDSLRKELEELVRDELPGARDLPGLAARRGSQARRSRKSWSTAPSSAWAWLARCASSSANSDHSSP